MPFWNTPLRLTLMAPFPNRSYVGLAQAADEPATPTPPGVFQRARGLFSLTHVEVSRFVPGLFHRGPFRHGSPPPPDV